MRKPLKNSIIIDSIEGTRQAPKRPKRCQTRIYKEVPIKKYSYFRKTNTADESRVVTMLDGLSVTMLEHLRCIWECSRSDALRRLLRPLVPAVIEALKYDDTFFETSYQWSLRKEDWEDWRRKCLE